MESLNRQYNERCSSNKTRKIIKSSFEFMSDRAYVKRLQQRKRNHQTIQRQNIQYFKQQMLEYIYKIDITQLNTKSDIELVTRSIFDQITATIHLTDE